MWPVLHHHTCFQFWKNMLIKIIELIPNHINNSKQQNPVSAALNIKENYLHFIHDNSNATSLCHISFMH